MTLRRVTAVASDNSRCCYRKAAVGFRMYKDNPPLPVLYLGSSRCARPLPRGFTGHVAHPSRSIHRTFGVASVFAKATT